MTPARETDRSRGRSAARDLLEAIIRRFAPALIAVLSATLVAAPALTAGAEPAATTYSVDCSAKTAGDGVNAPWRTLAAVNAHGAFAPGDRILFKRGTTCKGRLSPKGSGTAGSPIVVGDYGSRKRPKPTIAGGGTPMETSTLALRNQAYVTLEDLHVTNRTKASTTTVFRSGVLLVNDGAGMLPGVTVQRLTVNDVTSKLFYAKGHDARDWGGITVHTPKRSGGNGFDGLRILNNTVTGVGRTGIVTSNRDYPTGLDRTLRIAGNTVTRTRGDGIIMRGAKYARVDHNRVKDASNMWPCAQCRKAKGMGANAGIWPTVSSESVIEYNNISGTHVGHGDGEAIDLDIGADRVVVQYNYLHDNDGGGVLFCGSTSSTVRFNIFENNKKSAIAFIGSVPAKKSSVHNNTIYSSKQADAIIVRTFNGLHGSGISFMNNLVYSNGRGGRFMFPTKHVTFSANTLVGARGSGEPKGTGTSRKDPGLKAPGSAGSAWSTLRGYRPKHPSTFPRGAAVSSTITHDFFGKRIDPKRPPRGAAG